MSGDRYRVVATTRFGGRRLVYYRGDGNYSWRKGKRGREWMTPSQADTAKRWCARKMAKNPRAVPTGKHPFLELAPGAVWPTNRDLLRALNGTGQRRRRTVKIISGMRTPRQAWELRMAMLNGTGNTAARCCTKYSGLHSWDQCGKNPQSNHAGGNAADCGTLTSKGEYTSLASDRRARRIFQRLGGCFPVTSPWEPWHAEMR